MVVFGVPALRLEGVTNDPVLLGGAALAPTHSPGVRRGGLPGGHRVRAPLKRAAARSLGLSSGKTLRFVVLPQAVRRAVPPLLNDLVSLQKDTGLVSIAGAVDAVYAAQIIASKDFDYTPGVVAVRGLVFVALTIPITRLTDWVTARMDRRRAQGGRGTSTAPVTATGSRCCGWRPSASRSVRRWCCGTRTWRSPRTP
ncbi:hypothetical protein SMICM17S_06324 [Streptomyces microflavus]